MKILFTSTQLTSFISQDLDLLRKHHTVDHVTTRGIFAPFTILRHISGVHTTFTWFASVYSCAVVFLARRKKKRSILVIGGVDVARVPEMRYGIWLSPWKRPLVGYALRNASRVLAVDESLKEKAIRQARYSGTNIVCIPTGYDASRWHPQGQKESFVLTVAKCEDEWKLKVKGIDRLLECARLLPDVRFVVVGLAAQLAKRVGPNVSPNVELVDMIEQSRLLRWYQRARVYCQPSYSEGFPNSVCEAMLCECVPVGTNVGGIPHAIGDSGFVVPYGDVPRLAEAIEKALTSPVSLARSARARISEHFTLEKRESSLVRILEETMK